MSKSLLYFLIIIGISVSTLAQTKTNLVGYVFDESTKEPLENCNIYVSKLGKGTTSDENGKFLIPLPPNHYKIIFSYVGFESKTIELELLKNTTELKVFLTPTLLKSNVVEVIGFTEPAEIVIQKIENKDLEKMPTIYSDVLRSVQVLSGVSTNNELTSGYNVRGGSYDENLIYLNGYEIYRPFLLRVGVEENQTTINPYMVEKLTFYNGAFSANYGDRMSSALDVNYSTSHNNKLKGTIYTSLLNSGIVLKNKIKDFNWSLGLRYANPTSFVSSLQSRGDYNPSFSDVQIISNYRIGHDSELEFLGIYSDNKFNVNPTDWQGNFGFLGRGDYRGISIKSDGKRNYSYLNNLMGIKFKSKLSHQTYYEFSVSRYWVNEKEDYNVNSNIMYFPDAYNPNSNLELLKTRTEITDNSLELNSYRFKGSLSTRVSDHNLRFGAEYRISKINNSIYEFFNETGDSLLTERPIQFDLEKEYNLNSLSLFVEDYILINDYLEANVGLRYLNYEYSNENLFSPRAYLIYKISPINTLKFSWGYYYQPPFINELKSTQIESLKSQRSIHYVLGWENQVNETLKFNAEIYYKDFHNLIPFYFDEFRMNYVGSNSLDGYAFGVDLMYEGEIVEGMKSWIGYSFLDTKQKKIGGSEYERRLLDQTHTVQIFLQDKFKKHPNWQSHLRFLVGSGYLYYLRQLSEDQQTSASYIDVNLKNPQEYLFYLRVDMGLSANFDLGGGYNITSIAEILNVFNRFNAGAYEWMHIFKDFNAPIKIPHILSKRFLNLKVELRF